jgi:hypothetical protein
MGRVHILAAKRRKNRKNAERGTTDGADGTDRKIQQKGTKEDLCWLCLLLFGMAGWGRQNGMEWDRINRTGSEWDRARRQARNPIPLFPKARRRGERGVKNFLKLRDSDRWQGKANEKGIRENGKRVA